MSTVHPMVNRIVELVKLVDQLEEEEEFYYMFVKMRQVLKSIRPRHKEKIKTLLTKIGDYIDIIQMITGNNPVQTVARRRAAALNIYYDQGGREMMSNWTDHLWNGGYFTNKGYDTIDLSDDSDYMQDDPNKKPDHRVSVL